jgi:hypothetical protein
MNTNNTSRGTLGFGASLAGTSLVGSAGSVVKGVKVGALVTGFSWDLNVTT